MTLKELREDRRPADLWYWNDWFSSFDVRSCSLAARGLWMDMLGIMRNAEAKGSLTVNGKQIDGKHMAKITGAPEDEINSCLRELEDNNVFSRLEDGTIINRRMYRESKISAARAEAGKKGASSRWQTDSKGADIGDGKAIADIEDEDENEDSSKGGVGGETKFEPRHIELAKFLETKIIENVPYHKFTGSNYLESWGREFRLMEKRDKIPFHNIEAVLKWSLDDEFWRINILSAGTFREKFGRLAAKMRSGRGDGKGRREPDHPQVGVNIKADKSPEYWDEVRRLKAEGMSGQVLTDALAKFGEGGKL